MILIAVVGGLWSVRWSTGVSIAQFAFPWVFFFAWFVIFTARVRLFSLWSRTYEPGSIVFESVFGKTVWPAAECRFIVFFRTNFFSNGTSELKAPVICRHEPTQKRMLLWPRQRELNVLISSLARDHAEHLARSSTHHADAIANYAEATADALPR